MTTNQDELKSLLRQARPELCPATGCPGNEVLASYMEGGLSESDHAAFERHLADCAGCMDQVGIIGRAQSREPTGQLPDLTLARARRLAKPRFDARPWWRRGAPRWAAAAIVVLAVSLVMRGPQTVDTSIDARDIRTQRNIQPLSPVPRLLSPSENARIDLAHARFAWSPVAHSLYYRVRIVSDTGDLLWQEQVRGTHWSPPPALRLHSGGDYFVRIDAYLTEAKSVSSDYIAFRVDEGPLR